MSDHAKWHVRRNRGQLHPRSAVGWLAWWGWSGEARPLTDQTFWFSTWLEALVFVGAASSEVDQ